MDEHEYLDFEETVYELLDDIVRGEPLMLSNSISSSSSFILSSTSRRIGSQLVALRGEFFQVSVQFMDHFPPLTN